MSTKRGRSKLEEYFETGDRPTEQQFAELIHSELNQKDDDIHAKDKKIGIGTENPTAKLHVQGNNLDPNSDGVLRIDVINSNPNSDANLRFGVFNGGTKFSWIQAHGNQPLKINSIGNNTLLNDTNGNVGIGTENPTEKLHVKGNISVENGDMLWDKKGDRFTIRPVNDIGGGRIELFDTNSTDQNSGGITFVAEGNSIKNGYRFLHFNPSDNKWTSSLRIDGEGNQTLFDKTIYFRAYGNRKDEHHGIGWFGDGYDPSSTKRFAGENVDGPVLFGNNGGALGSNSGRENIVMRWKDNGNVGIGINNPSHKLDVNGNISIHNGAILGNESLNTFSIFSNKSVFDGPTILFRGKNKQNLDDRGSITFVANNSHQPQGQAAPANETAFDFVSNGETYNWNSLMRIRKNGNIGIGTTDPQEKLDINGNIRLNSNRLYLKDDINHGICYLNEYPRLNIGESATKPNIDGPFVFGFSGGALGTVDGRGKTFETAPKKIALEWNNNNTVNFNGKLRVKGQSFFELKSFYIGREKKDPNIIYPSQGFSARGKIKNYPVSKWTAIVAGFQYDHLSKINSGAFMVHLKRGTHHWEIEIDFPGEDWNHYVDVLFIRNELF